MQSICVKSFYGTEVVYERNEKIDFTDCPCFSGKAYSGAKGKKICMKDMSPRAMT